MSPPPPPNTNDFKISLTNERDPMTNEKNISVDENAFLAEQRIWKQYIYEILKLMRPTYVTLAVPLARGVRGQACSLPVWPLVNGDDATGLFSLTIPHGPPRNRDFWAVSTSRNSLNSDSCDYMKENCLGKSKSIIAVRRLTRWIWEREYFTNYK